MEWEGKGDSDYFSVVVFPSGARCDQGGGLKEEGSRRVVSYFEILNAGCWPCLVRKYFQVPSETLRTMIGRSTRGFCWWASRRVEKRREASVPHSLVLRL